MKSACFRAARHRNEGPTDRTNGFGRMLAIGIENGEADRGTARSHPAYPSLPCMVRHAEFGPPRSGNKANRLPVDRLDPMGKMFFNIRATFAEFESDLIRMRTREGMKIARAKGKLRGKKPKLSDRQQSELRRMYDTGDYSVSDLAEL